MAKKLVLNLKILAGKANVKRVLIAKHWEEEIIDHILKVMVCSPIEKEECVERRAPTTHQVSKAFVVSLNPSRFLEIATDFRIPRCSKQLMNSPSESSLFT